MQGHFYDISFVEAFTTAHPVSRGKEHRCHYLDGELTMSHCGSSMWDDLYIGMATFGKI